jgi:dTMP kinase
MRQGPFIVIEGVDGAGTTTQALQLSAALSSRRLAVRTTREPSSGPIGALLRLCLSGRLVTPGQYGSHAPSWQTMALMFAADRLDHIEAEIAPLVGDGVWVISDRYYHSSLAYQSCTSGAGVEAITFIRAINAQARKPDLTIVLDVAASVAADRRRLRGGVELYDDEALQAELGNFYARIEGYFPGEPIVHVSGDGAIEQVARAVLAEIEKHLAEFF